MRVVFSNVLKEEKLPRKIVKDLLNLREAFHFIPIFFLGGKDTIGGGQYGKGYWLVGILLSKLPEIGNCFPFAIIF